MLRQKPISNSPCKYCGSDQHTSLMCFSKPRRPLRKESKSTYSKRTAVSRLWFELNPPNVRGVWHCYLRIAPNCLGQLTRTTIRLEHVKSKVRYPELKYDVSNLKPACEPCNKMKGSRDLDEIPEYVMQTEGGQAYGLETVGHN